MGPINFHNYLTYSDEDEKWQIVCTSVGHVITKPAETYPPEKQLHPLAFQTVKTGRTLNEFQIVYISAGQGEFHSGDTRWKVEEGSVLLLFPQVPHSYAPDPQTGWEEYWVGFKGKYPQMLLAQNIINSTTPYLHLGFSSILLECFQEIAELQKIQRPLYQARIASIIIALLAEILSSDREQKNSDHSANMVADVKKMLEKNIFSTVSIKDIANNVGVSLSHLDKIFKTYTGMSPLQYYHSIKINMACELLLTKTDSVKELADLLGFEDQFYFSRLFKQKTGLAPKYWLAQHGNKK